MENSDKVETNEIKTSRYICNRCQKSFKDSTGLTKHITLKKVRCDGVIDTDYWLVKQTTRLHDRYKKLQAISELDDNIMDLEEKRKVLKAFYLKACNILKVMLDNKSVCPSISDEDVMRVTVYIQNCKTGDFYNTVILNTSEE